MAALTPEEVLQKVAEAATDSASKQYDDYTKTFVALDSKALAAGTGGGVLLGVIVALANSGKLGKLLESGEGWIVWASFLPILAAVLGMVLGVLGAKVKNVNVPFDAVQQIKEFDGLLRVDKAAQTRNVNETQDGRVSHVDLLGFHVQRHNQWALSLASMDKAVKSKGRYVLAAQWCLLAATVLTTLVVGLAAFRTN